MSAIDDTTFDRIARTLYGYCLLGFVNAHEAAGGRVPACTADWCESQGVRSASIFDVFNDIFGGNQ